MYIFDRKLVIKYTQQRLLERPSGVVGNMSAYVYIPENSGTARAWAAISVHNNYNLAHDRFSPCSQRMYSTVLRTPYVYFDHFRPAFLPFVTNNEARKLYKLTGPDRCSLSLSLSVSSFSPRPFIIRQNSIYYSAHIAPIRRALRLISNGQQPHARDAPSSDM